jgi:NarL family two-component system response regulator LiaR
MTEPVDPITVMIVDDHEMVRRGACGYLEAQVDIRVVAQAGSGEEAVRLAQEFTRTWC